MTSSGERAVVSELANSLNMYLDFRRYEQQVEAVYSYSRNALSCSHFAMVYYSDELSRACPSIPGYRSLLEGLHNIHDVWLALAQADLASVPGEPAGGGAILTPAEIRQSHVQSRRNAWKR